MSSNSHSEMMDFERDLVQVGKQYSEEGYNVVIHPGVDDLPKFAEGFDVDLLASRDDESVLVEVKRDREDLKDDPNVPQLAEITNHQPGWRFDLIVLNESDPLRRMTQGAREPSHQEIDELLGYVEKLLTEDELWAAHVFAWAALEATMRQVASDGELHHPNPAPRELLSTLYGNGFLTRDEFDQLSQSFRVRTEIVHGLIPPTINADSVRAIIKAIRRLLTGNPDAQTVAS